MGIYACGEHVRPDFCGQRSSKQESSTFRHGECQSLIIDQEVQIHRISMDLPAILSFPKIDKHIATSTVEEIAYRDDGNLEIVTMNTIYFLERI